MSISIRGRSDRPVEAIAEAFKGYEARHPHARIEVYRQNSASIRVRVIDEDFAGISQVDRHEILWSCIEALPEDFQGEMSLLIAVTPEETGSSIASIDFDHPIPSRL